jgi:hypothetical protein
VTITNPDAVKVIEQFTEALDKFNITVNVPEQQPPSVLVNIPEQQAPVVNVAAPVINVEVPKQAAPVVNVTVPERKPRKVVVRRDNLGLIEGLEEK